MDILDLYKKFIDDCNQQLCTDTREIILGSMFFAWKGEERDGNEFAEQALKLGCSYVIVDNPNYVINRRCILVENTIETLQNLANHHRKQFDIPVIALTGSNGKTTTKELIARVLEQEKNIIATEGNLNNHVGVPKILLRITNKTEIAVIEMGANHVGEIALLCEIAEPNFGIITNIGRAHLGLFGGFEGVVQAKTELYNYLNQHKGHVFVNASDELLIEKSRMIQRTLYGTAAGGIFKIDSHMTQPFVSLIWNQQDIQTHLTGEYNIDNIAMAIAVGVYFNIQTKNIKKALENYTPTNSRSEIVELKNNNTIIKDYYNANVSSMELALQSFNNIKTDKKKIAILGDMFELGDYEDQEHKRIVDFIKSFNFDQVIIIGKVFSRIKIPNNIITFTTTDEAVEYLQSQTLQNNYIFLKASNGMKFEKVFKYLEKI